MTSQALTPSRIAADPRLFAATFLKILDKRNELRPLAWNRAQQDFHQHRTKRDLILKARQLGFSTYVQGEMFRRTVTSSRTTITLAHDDDTTKKLRIMADRFYQHCEFNGIRPRRDTANAVLTTYPEFDSTASIGTAGSVEKGRGGTYSDFHGSEVAFWPDAEKLIAGALQGGDPDAILESTPNGAQGYFYELCIEALHGDGAWKLHFYPWWWDEHYAIPLARGEKLRYDDEEQQLVKLHRLTEEQVKWRRAKRRELKGKFIQEYPEDPVSCFLTSGRGYFGDLTDVFTAPADAEYDPKHEYVGGIDFGQVADFTALPVFDLNAKAQVDLLYVNGLPWAEIRHRIKQIAYRWHLESVLAEENSIGSVNIEALGEDERDAEGKVIYPGIAVIPFTTTNDSKAQIISGLHERLHDGWKLLPIPQQQLEFNTFVATQLPSGAWRLAASGDGHDDIVMADAIALGGPPIQVFI